MARSTQEASMGYTVLRLDELDWSTPAAGDQSRGIVRLSDALEHMRANIWKLPGETEGRRHAEKAQEEIFVVLAGTATMALGDPPQRVELPRGSVVIVEPGTALQQRNDGDEDVVILAIGAPREEPGNADYLPDAS
jgi:mannose-6-phosphate isomerase-like protein (cupin superfamily)